MIYIFFGTRSAHAYSATPLDIIQVCIFLLIFSWFGHPPRKLLKKMGENTIQPRLEHIISKQFSAWPLIFLFQTLQYMSHAAFFFDNITFLAYNQIFP